MALERVFRPEFRKNQRGFSLLLALVFVAFFGSILAGIALFNRDSVRVAEADVAGWELVQIGKAARLYMRDQLVLNPNLRDLTQNPTRLPIATLKAQGYLPQNFGRSVGALDFNALNQEVYVIMANWLPTGLTVTNDPNSVPTAFVYYRDGGKSDPHRVIDMVDSARKYGATITAPLFDFFNNNRSADCRGSGPAAGLWDTGCLTVAEFNNLITTPLGLPVGFNSGALIVPVWKTSQHDLRAVMRFPQPENPGYSTMLTDLGMARRTRDNDGVDDNNCNPTVGDVDDTDEITITTVDASGNVVTTSTGLCDVMDDTAAEDNRFSITNVANMATQRVISEPQASGQRLVTQPGTSEFGGVDAANLGTGNDESFNVSGNVVLGNDLRVFNSRALNGIGTRFSIPNASLAVDRNAYVHSQSVTNSGIARVGTVSSGGSLITDRLTTGTFNSTINGTTTGAPRISVTNALQVDNTTEVRGTATSELITETIEADFVAGLRPGATVIARADGGNVQITNRLNLSGANMVVGGANPIGAYGAIIGNIDDADNVTVTGFDYTSSDCSNPNPALRGDLCFLSSNSSLTVGTTRNYNGTSPMPVATVQNTAGNAECLEGLNVSDACPNRQYFVPFILP